MSAIEDVEVEVEETGKRTTPVMERMESGPAADGAMITIVGHVDLILTGFLL